MKTTEPGEVVGLIDFIIRIKLFQLVKSNISINDNNIFFRLFLKMSLEIVFKIHYLR